MSTMAADAGEGNSDRTETVAPRPPHGEHAAEPPSAPATTAARLRRKAVSRPVAATPAGEEPTVEVESAAEEQPTEPIAEEKAEPTEPVVDKQAEQTEPVAEQRDEPATAAPREEPTPAAGTPPTEPPPALGRLADALSGLRATIGGATYPLVMPSAEEAERVGAALVSQLDD